MIDFWERVMKSDGCWEWTGPRNPDGYGKVSSLVKAHRLSWEMCNGVVPSGLHVLHTCDNRACVRPDHLFLGTHQDNMRDREAKGRGIRGERVGIARFNEISIRRIRIAGQAISKYRIAEALNCVPSTIDAILTNKTWKHVHNGVRLI